MEQKEKDLMDALQYAGVPKLPAMLAAGSRRIWTSAIMEVSKVNGEKSYAVVRNVYGRAPKIMKVFGSVAAIAKTGDIFPYAWLRKEMIPSFKSDEERTEFIAKSYGETGERVAELPLEDRDRLLYSFLIERQFEFDRGNRR